MNIKQNRLNPIGLWKNSFHALLLSCRIFAENFGALVRLAGVLLLGFVLALMITEGSIADELAQPSGSILLSVNGDIAHKNAPDGAHFDRAMLDAIGLDEFTTHTPFSEDAIVWRGVSLSKLLDAVGAGEGNLMAEAIDFYSIEISRDILEKYNPIIALDRDGQAMTIRDKGPAWIIFNWDAYPEINNAEFAAYSIWQLKTITVQ